MTPTIVICDVDGTLTDGRVWVDGNGNETLCFNKRDGWLIGKAREAGIGVVFVTSDPNPEPAKRRAAKLGVMWSLNKFHEVASAQTGGLRVVYIGNDASDVEAMKAADESWCPEDASPEAHAVATHLTSRCGGEGVLYEVLRELLARREGGETWQPVVGDER